MLLLKKSQGIDVLYLLVGVCHVFLQRYEKLRELEISPIFNSLIFVICEF